MHFSRASIVICVLNHPVFFYYGFHSIQFLQYSVSRGGGLTVVKWRKIWFKACFFALKLHASCNKAWSQAVIEGG
jgi:hypothetical protein